MRSAGSTYLGLDFSVVTFTKPRIDCFAGPSFQDGRGLRNLSLQPTTLPRPSAHRKQKTFREPYPKIWSLAPSSSHPPIKPSRLTTSSNGGATSRAQIGDIPMAPTATSRARRITRSSPSPMTTLSPTRNGQTSVFPPKRSGSSPPVVVSLGGPSSGATPSVPTASTWQILSRVTSQTKIPATTDSAPPRLSPSFLPTATACMTWPGTSGNGPPTGIAPTTIGSWPPPAVSVAIRSALTTPSIPTSQQSLCAAIKWFH